jgi:CheY-like chemotaxis protein
MSPQIKKESTDPCLSITQYYLNIINSMPNIVYWMDKNTVLKGCNNNFVDYFELKTLKDFSGSPYDSMALNKKWSIERINALKLDDMQVLFSGEATKDIEEAPIIQTSDGKALYFVSHRIPLLNEEKEVIGLVVTLCDVTKYKILEKQIYQNKKKTIRSTHTKKTIHQPKVLMIEDNYLTQKVEEALLTSLNCQVNIAHSGEEAISMFNPGKYDLIFLDIGLEDTSGYMVAKKIRAMEKETQYHVPIIALTAYQAEVVKYDCHDYSMDGVISKPLTIEQAKQIIQFFVYHENVEIKGLQL